ncbi:MAG TPA: glycosyltransferase family 2 protein [Clostridia bacterium]|nr:glycosyltransferase family 2 protein [Clostridia bacterium]
MYEGQEMSRPGVSVVVPVYNSSVSLAKLVDRLEQVLGNVASDYELVLVNDGSQDASWETICALAKGRPWVRGIQLMRNYGQHNALLCGIRAAAFATVVTLDDDGQNPPEEIPKLLERLAEGYDVVYGVPDQQQHGLWRNAASCLAKLAIQSVLGAESARHVSAFKAFHTRVRESFADCEGAYVSIDVLLTWGARRVGSVKVRHEARQLGKSNYTFRRLVIHAFNMVTSFGLLPLHLASLVGFCFTFFGAAVLAYVVGRYLLQGGSVAGFPFLASIIAIFSGAQLFVLGMMGEYLARIHARSMHKPAYVVADETALVPETRVVSLKTLLPDTKGL